MKAFINLLIKTDVYSTVEDIEDAVLALFEEEAESLKVIWSKSSEANRQTV